MQKLATQANFSNWEQAQYVIEEVVDAINCLNVTANQLGGKARDYRPYSADTLVIRSSAWLIFFEKSLSMVIS